jgi:transcription initiation factor TFIID/TFIIF subunit
MLSEQGWGEFDMTIVFSLADKSGDYPVQHDLHFQKSKYDTLHSLVSFE